MIIWDSIKTGFLGMKKKSPDLETVTIKNIPTELMNINNNSALCTYKKLVVVVIYIRLKKLISILQSYSKSIKEIPM